MDLKNGGVQPVFRAAWAFWRPTTAGNFGRKNAFPPGLFHTCALTEQSRALLVPTYYLACGGGGDIEYVEQAAE